MELTTPITEHQNQSQLDNSTSTDSANIAVTAPGRFRVIRRNGKVTTYDREKIAIAMTKAFLAVEGGNAAASSRIHEIVGELAEQVEQALTRRIPDGGTFHIEDIQDQVELALMRSGHQRVARAYVIYREEHARARQQQQDHALVEDILEDSSANIEVTLADGSRQPLDTRRLQAIVN
ncbi:MAG: ATP cone domain-containing protein, partial [Gammaproteobacteria bacterium]